MVRAHRTSWPRCVSDFTSSSPWPSSSMSSRCAMRGVQYTIGVVPDSGDSPPRKPRRAKRPEPDFVIDPSNPNATVELETADLLQLGQSGLVEGRANKTRELGMSDLEELREGMPIQDPKIIVDLGPDPAAAPKDPTVFVDFGELDDARASSQMEAQRAPSEPRARGSSAMPVAPTPIVRGRTPTPMPVPRTKTAEVRARRGIGLVVVVYLVSAAALAISIYLRWFAT